MKKLKQVHIEHSDTVSGEIILTSRVIGGVSPYEYVWEMASYNQNPLLDIIINSPANLPDIHIARAGNQYENRGMVSLTVTDAKKNIVKSFFQVQFTGA